MILLSEVDFHKCGLRHIRSDAIHPGASIIVRCQGNQQTISSELVVAFMYLVQLLSPKQLTNYIHLGIR